ncbi:membrane protein insertase YidC [soil metagenome]
MDIFAFPPIAFLLSAAYWFVEFIAGLLEPLAGAAGPALAIVVLTLLVRALLIPVSVSQVKAEWTRRRLAPKLRALQLKYKTKPEVLQRKIAELYRDENASPLAGILPTLAQAPVVSLVYALFIRGTIGGHANLLLAAGLGGVPLGTSLVTAGIAWPGILVFGGLLGVIAVTAWMSRRIAQRLAMPADAPAAARLNSVLSWLPFVTVLFAAVVPLAAAIYLATTTTWTLIERALLRRRYWVETA